MKYLVPDQASKQLILQNIGSLEHKNEGLVKAVL